MFNFWLGCWKPKSGGATVGLKMVDAELDRTLVWISPSNYFSLDILRIIVTKGIERLVLTKTHKQTNKQTLKS